MKTKLWYKKELHKLLILLEEKDISAEQIKMMLGFIKREKSIIIEDSKIQRRVDKVKIE